MSNARYWTLTELEGETPDDPGGLVRRVEDDGGVRFEVLIGERWEDRTPHFVWLTFEPTHGDAPRVDADHARRLEATWPTPHAPRVSRGNREGLMRGHVRKRGSSWSFVVDAGDQLAQRCANSCRRLVWHDDKHDECPRCGGSLTAPVLTRRQRWSSSYLTQSEAERALRAALGRLDAGDDPVPPETPVSELAERSFEHLAAQDKPRPRVRQGYERIIRSRVLPMIGGLEVQKVSPRTSRRSSTHTGPRGGRPERSRACAPPCRQCSTRRSCGAS
jgi:hypothetical protein